MSSLLRAGSNLQVLRRARELDCPWDESTCAAAAHTGQLEVLVWAREHGCPWEENIYENPEFDCCALAAFGGHLEVLTWLWEQGNPWNEWT